MNSKLLIGILIIGIVLLAWSPWITKSYAEEKVVNDFSERWYGVADGCGFNCPNCGMYESKKVLFGYEVIILYSCGFKPIRDIPDWQDKILVSFLGTVHTISHENNLD